MTVETTSDALRAMKGGVATLWSYSASLEELTIRVEFPGKRGNFHIVCNGTRLIHCPTGRIDLNLVATEESKDRLALVDESKGVHIVAGLIRILRDVEPVFET